MRVNRLTDVHGIRAHLNRQRNHADHVARVRADPAAAEDLAVAVGVGAAFKFLLPRRLIYRSPGLRSNHRRAKVLEFGSNLLQY